MKTMTRKVVCCLGVRLFCHTSHVKSLGTKFWFQIHAREGLDTNPVVMSMRTETMREG